MPFEKAPLWILGVFNQSRHSQSVTAGFSDNNAVCQQPFKELQITFTATTDKLELLMGSDVTIKADIYFTAVLKAGFQNCTLFPIKRIEEYLQT